MNGGHHMQQAATGFGAVLTTWNPADIGINLSLKNFNKTATHSASANFNGGRGTIGRDSGIHSFRVNYDSGTNNAVLFGIAPLTQPLNSGVGGNMEPGTITYFDGGDIFDGVSVIDSAPSFDPGHFIDIVVNFTTLKVAFFKNGVGQSIVDIHSGLTYFPYFIQRLATVNSIIDTGW